MRDSACNALVMGDGWGDSGIGYRGDGNIRHESDDVQAQAEAAELDFVYGETWTWQWEG